MLRSCIIGYFMQFAIAIYMDLFFSFNVGMAIRISFMALLYVLTSIIEPYLLISKNNIDYYNISPLILKTQLSNRDDIEDIKDITNKLPLIYILLSPHGYDAYYQYCCKNNNDIKTLKLLTQICFFKQILVLRIEKLYVCMYVNL